MIRSLHLVTWPVGALLAIGCNLVALPADAFPVTVRSCSDDVTLRAAPLRPIVNDANMTQTIIDMGLLDRFVGIGGIAGIESQIVASPDDMAQIKKKEFSARYPTMEAILGQNADFYFAGWGYGFSEATGVTPAGLQKFGIAAYVLGESCIKIGPRAPISMETMYQDVLALGEIFGVADRARAMVADFRARVKSVTDKTERASYRPRVMYCGDCNSDNPPLTIGAEGMPKLLASLAGGTNIFDDVRDSYVHIGWESVIDRDPEWMILSDHRIPAAEMVAYLTSRPILKNVAAIAQRHFVPMYYAERSPSTRNVEALERLARALHPELFAP